MTAPQQERSWRSRARVIDAARTLLIDRGHEAVALADVARLADVAVGTIYTRFSDKTALLREVHREQASEMAAHSLRALEALDQASASHEQIVDGAVRAVAEVVFRHAVVMRPLFILAGSDEVIRQQGAEIILPVAKAFCATVSRSGASHRADPDFAASVCFDVIFAACAHRITLGTAVPALRQISADNLVDELVRMTACYLADTDKQSPPSAPRR